MKLTFKAAMIIALLLILASNSYALNEWEVASALALQEVSTDNLIYECSSCSKEGQESEQGGLLVWYICNQDVENCELSISEKVNNAPRKIGTLKFTKARVYFTAKKLSYIQAFRANANNLPYEVNNIKIPYLSAGDKIDFALANPQSANVNSLYFSRFYYVVGDYNQAGAQLTRNPYPVPGYLVTSQNTRLQRGYWRPVSLCGQEFFDGLREEAEITVEGRQIVPLRETKFLVEATSDNCVVNKYRLSARQDPIYENDIPKYSRQYLCGDALYDLYSAYATNMECVADTGELEREKSGDILRCPQSQNNNNPERLACLQQSIISLLAGSTRYYLKSDLMHIDASTEFGTDEESEVPKSVFLKAKVENTVNGLGAPLVSIKGRDSWVIVKALPTACEDSLQGCYDIRIDSGRKVGAPSNSESWIELPNSAEGIIEFWDLNRRNLLRRYVLHNPNRKANYVLLFKDNELMEINNLNKISTGTSLGELRIRGLRIVYPVSATLRGAAASVLRVREFDTVNLYPLQEGQDEAIVNRPSLTYFARSSGERLFDIAARFYGAESIEQIQERPGEIGAQLPQIAESQETREAVIEFAREIKLYNQQRNNKEIWVNSPQENPVLFSGEQVYIPLNALSYVSRRNGNSVTIHNNPAQAYQGLFERQRSGQEQFFSLGRQYLRFMDLAAQTQSLQPERQINMPLGKAITGMQTRELPRAICQDSDERNNNFGDNPEINGIVAIRLGARYRPFEQQDTCAGEANLLEYFCNGNNLGSRLVYCTEAPYNSFCFLGACKRLMGRRDVAIRAEALSDETVLNYLRGIHCISGSKSPNAICQNARQNYDGNKRAYCDINGICRPNEFQQDELDGVNL